MKGIKYTIKKLSVHEPFTVFCLVSLPLNGSEAGGDLS